MIKSFLKLYLFTLKVHIKNSNVKYHLIRYQDFSNYVNYNIDPNNNMTDLTSLGYPEGYHLGLSSLLWWITVFVLIVLAVMLYLNARKSDLINVKEMLRAKSFNYICISILISLIQVGVFFPDNFLLFYSFGVFISISSGAFYFYYWEKNLTTIKRIPTIAAITAAIIALIVFVTSIFFLLPGFLSDFLTFIIFSLMTVAFILYIYLIYSFSRNVKGVSTKVAGIWIVGVPLLLAAFFSELPPGVKILPAFFVLYFPPILYMIALSMAFYCINRLFTQISSYYAQTQKCIVHRGTIEKGNTVYYCPSCSITYCESCFNQVIKKDGCWNCRKGAEVEIEEEWKADIVVELEKRDKPKHKKYK